MVIIYKRLNAKMSQKNMLIPMCYNPRYIPIGQGLQNMGATCYLNSLLQCILSCSALYETLENLPKNILEKSKCAVLLLDMFRTALVKEPIDCKPMDIWREIIGISMSRSDRIKCISGFQDVHETLYMFMDSIENIEPLTRLFTHRVKKIVQCKCGKQSSHYEENAVFEIQADLKNDVDHISQQPMRLDKFLHNQIETVSGYRCAQCGDTGDKFIKTILVMVPEIIIVLFKKYNARGKINCITQFPMELFFESKSLKLVHKYIFVAQSEHGGGHYWTIAKRADGWKILNDINCQSGNPGPTTETYMCVYHYAGFDKIGI